MAACGRTGPKAWRGSQHAPRLALVVVAMLMATGGAAALEPATGADGDRTATIQPGVALVTPHATCTAGFVFTDPAGALYLATAGHCFGDTVECRYDAARVRVDGLGEVGSKVFCVRDGIGNDLALVRIDAAHRDAVEPAILVWGGPTTADGPVFGVTRHYGHGTAYDAADATRARTGHGFERDEDSFRMMGLVMSGDSGSPVRSDDGHAIGIITHANGNLALVSHSAPYGYGTTIQRIHSLAEGAGFQLTLRTAALA